MKEPNRYKILQINLDADGIYNVEWVGTHSAQGGPGFGWGSIGGFKTLLDAAKTADKLMKKYKDIEKINEMIEEREKD